MAINSRPLLCLKNNPMYITLVLYKVNLFFYLCDLVFGSKQWLEVFDADHRNDQPYHVEIKIV